mmetsp:Transcript_17722/g.36309  ORF Transcript_17722/g.36309 Transcript_17722/m.36309 type:complete len:317 (+) Transcript_17722:300-1250(+)
MGHQRRAPLPRPQGPAERRRGDSHLPDGPRHPRLRDAHPAPGAAEGHCPCARTQVQLALHACERDDDELCHLARRLPHVIRIPGHRPVPESRPALQLEQRQRRQRQLCWEQRPLFRNGLRIRFRRRHRDAGGYGGGDPGGGGQRRPRQQRRRQAQGRRGPPRDVRRPGLQIHRLGIRLPDHWHHLRSCLGERSVGLLLELGSKGDLGPDSVAFLRHLPPRSHLQGLVAQADRGRLRRRLRRRLDVLRRRQPLRRRSPQLRLLQQVKQTPLFFKLCIVYTRFRLHQLVQFNGCCQRSFFKEAAWGALLRGARWVLCW